MQQQIPEVFRIQDLSLEDRPREKMRGRGCRALTDAELIAVILGSGMRGISALNLSRRILAGADNDLHTLARQDLPKYLSYPGVGDTKALRLLAALELGRRRERARPREQPLIASGKQVFTYLRPLVGDLPHEELYVLCLNRVNRLLGHHRVSEGGTTATIADAKRIFRHALSHPSVTAIILAHNHPSGEAYPSEADIQLTRKLRAAATYLDLTLFDHVIIAGHRYYSFAEHEMIER